jgi:hypothetical protein
MVAMAVHPVSVSCSTAKPFVIEVARVERDGELSFTRHAGNPSHFLLRKATDHPSPRTTRTDAIATVRGTVRAISFAWKEAQCSSPLA